MHDEFADAVLENETDRAGSSLLVVRHRLHNPIDAHAVGQPDRQSDSRQKPLDSSDVVGRAVTVFLAQPSLKCQTNRHTLAMVEGIPGGRL